MVFQMWRQVLLVLAVFIAVGAFLPDTAHLEIAADNHADLPSDHEHNDVDAQEAHCHTSASCTGAVHIRSFSPQINIGVLLLQTRVAYTVNRTDHVLGNDPPVPIRSVS